MSVCLCLSKQFLSELSLSSPTTSPVRLRSIAENGSAIEPVTKRCVCVDPPSFHQHQHQTRTQSHSSRRFSCWLIYNIYCTDSHVACATNTINGGLGLPTNRSFWLLFCACCSITVEETGGFFSVLPTTPLPLPCV